MTTKKVVLHPLERLDIIDAEALQDLSHAAAENLVGTAVGFTTAGVTSPWAVVTLNSVAETITLGDFMFLGRRADGEGHSRNYPVYLGRYRSGNHTGTLSYSTALAAAQSYYDVNGSLPPSPIDDLFNAATHGGAYPIIYCRPVVTEDTEDTRRFWSASVNDEISRDVNTRTNVIFEFAMISPTTAPPSVSGFPWTRIGQIRGWQETDGVVSLPANEVRPYTLADSALGLGTFQLSAALYPEANIGGLSQALRFIMAHLDDLKQNGASDPSGTATVERYEVPSLSMAGLAKSIDNLTTEVNSKQHATAIIRILHDEDNPVISVQNATNNDFAIGALLDFTALRVLRSGQESIDYEDYNSQVFHIQAAMKRPILTLPTTFAGRAAHVMLTNIVSVDPLWTQQSDGSEAGSYYQYGGSVQVNLLTQDEAGRSACLGPSTINYQTLGASTDLEGFGFALDIGGLNATSNIYASTVRNVILFKADITVF